VSHRRSPSAGIGLAKNERHERIGRGRTVGFEFIGSGDRHRSDVDRRLAVVYYASMKVGRLNFRQRAEEKQRARDADAADLAAGRCSREDLIRSNSIFGGDPSILENARIIFPEKR
jgi:hypothetical protein